MSIDAALERVVLGRATTSIGNEDKEKSEYEIRKLEDLLKAIVTPPVTLSLKNTLTNSVMVSWTRYFVSSKYDASISHLPT